MGVQSRRLINPCLQPGTLHFPSANMQHFSVSLSNRLLLHFLSTVKSSALIVCSACSSLNLWDTELCSHKCVPMLKRTGPVPPWPSETEGKLVITPNRGTWSPSERLCPLWLEKAALWIFTYFTGDWRLEIHYLTQAKGWCVQKEDYRWQWRRSRIKIQTVIRNQGAR